MLRRMLGLCVLSLIAVACETSDPEDPVGSPPMSDRVVVADQHYGPENDNQAAAIALDETSAEAGWDYFRLGGSPLPLPGDEALLFVGTGESSSCPIEIEDLEVEGELALIETGETDGPCTTDFVPRTFVFSVARGDARRLRAVEIQGQRIPLRPIPRCPLLQPTGAADRDDVIRTARAAAMSGLSRKDQKAAWIALYRVRLLHEPIKGLQERRCPRIWDRTWNVQLATRFPKGHPGRNSASINFRNFLIGRTAHGWDVWYVLH